MSFNLTMATAGLLGEYGFQQQQIEKRRQDLEDRQAAEQAAQRREDAILTRQETLSKWNRDQDRVDAADKEGKQEIAFDPETKTMLTRAQVEQMKSENPDKVPSLQLVSATRFQQDQQDRELNTQKVNAEINRYNAEASKLARPDKQGEFSQRIDEINKLVESGQLSPSEGKAAILAQSGVDRSVGAKDKMNVKWSDDGGSAAVYNQDTGRMDVHYTPEGAKTAAMRDTMDWTKEKGKGLFNFEPSKEEQKAYFEAKYKEYLQTGSSQGQSPGIPGGMSGSAGNQLQPSIDKKGILGDSSQQNSDIVQPQPLTSNPDDTQTVMRQKGKPVSQEGQKTSPTANDIISKVNKDLGEKSDTGGQVDLGETLGEGAKFIVAATRAGMSAADLALVIAKWRNDQIRDAGMELRSLSDKTRATIFDSALAMAQAAKTETNPVDDINNSKIRNNQR